MHKRNPDREERHFRSSAFFKLASCVEGLGLPHPRL